MDYNQLVPSNSADSWLPIHKTLIKFSNDTTIILIMISIIITSVIMTLLVINLLIITLLIITLIIMTSLVINLL